MEDKHFAQAGDSYRRALTAGGDSAVVLDKLLGAVIYNRDWAAADDALGRLWTTKGSVWIGVLHNHALSYCQGEFTIAKDGLSFKPTSGDDAFTVKASGLVSIAPGVVGSGKLKGLPSFVLRVKDERGKEQKYDFAVPMFLNQPNSVQDTQRLIRQIVLFVQDNVK